MTIKTTLHFPFFCNLLKTENMIQIADGSGHVTYLNADETGTLYCTTNPKWDDLDDSEDVLVDVQFRAFDNREVEVERGTTGKLIYTLTAIDGTRVSFHRLLAER